MPDPVTSTGTAGEGDAWWFEDPEVYAKFVAKLKSDESLKPVAGNPATPAAATSGDIGHQVDMGTLVHKLVDGIVAKSAQTGPAPTPVAAPVAAAAGAVVEPVMSAWEKTKRKWQGLE